MNPAWEDGCTWWPDLWYRSCCDAHDGTYADGSVDWQSHVDLGICVMQSAPEGFAVVGFLIGVLLAAATSAWFALKHWLPDRLKRPSK